MSPEDNFKIRQKWCGCYLQERNITKTQCDPFVNSFYSVSIFYSLCMVIFPALISFSLPPVPPLFPLRTLCEHHSPSITQMEWVWSLHMFHLSFSAPPPQKKQLDPVVNHTCHTSACDRPWASLSLACSAIWFVLLFSERPCSTCTTYKHAFKFMQYHLCMYFYFWEIIVWRYFRCTRVQRNTAAQRCSSVCARLTWSLNPAESFW